MAHNMPRYALFFMIFTLASVGLPGTSGFVGEFLSMQGAYMVSPWVAAGAAVGVVLGAAYMLRLYRALFYGKLEKADVKAMPDLNAREWLMFAPLALLVIWMGVVPAHFKQYFVGSTTKIIADFNSAVAKAAPAAPKPKTGLELVP
jgi:NADH-quinone oxidoreductase subunit M